MAEDTPPRKPGRPPKDPNAPALSFDERVRRYARNPTRVKRCLDVLFQVADNKDAKLADRKAAATEYLNYAVGRAPQQEPVKGTTKPKLHIGLPTIGADIPEPTEPPPSE